MLSGHDELTRFLDKRANAFFKAMHDIFNARYGDSRSQRPIHDMADLISKTMVLADLNGRKRVLMEADYATKRSKFSEEKSPISSLPFDEAIDNLVSRDPRLAAGYLEVSKLYNTDHVFALAKSVNMNITKRIQKQLEDNYQSGQGLVEFEKLWEQITPWTRAYADTVYRTNTNTAYTGGRFKQAEDPDVAEVIPAMHYISMHLPTSRPNHEAADGLIAATNDPIWHQFKPPLGYNCQCGVNFISKYELERRGLIQNGKVIRYLPPGFSNAHPDDGFKVGAIDFEGQAA